MMNKPASKSSVSARRSAARLMAVQAVYQILIDGQAAAIVVPEYLAHRAGMEIDGEQMVEPDEPLFAGIVQGVEARRTDLEGLIAANRPADKAKSEPLLQATLLCGAYELLAHQETDPPLIISDYIDIAKAFFDGKEPGLVNGVLDAIRKVARN